jgi:hypothetical protein
MDKAAGPRMMQTMQLALRALLAESVRKCAACRPAPRQGLLSRTIHAILARLEQRTGWNRW